MKTYSQSSIVIIIYICLLLDPGLASAQCPEFVAGDDNYKNLLAFFRTDTLLVVTPDGFDLTAEDREAILSFPFWSQYQAIPHFRLLKESELTEADYGRRIQFYGPFNMFSNNNSPEIPFSKHEGGFVFGKYLYSGHGDAFCYLSDDTTRFYTCSNRGHGFTQYRTYMAGYYQLYIFRGDDLYLTGYADGRGDSSRINNLPEMRARYFVPMRSRYFDFEIASSMDVDSLRIIIEREVDNFADTLLSRFGVNDTLRDRILTYVYADRADLQKFIAAPAWTTVTGKASGNVNHLAGFDPVLFRHEAAHSIIEQVAGHNLYSFFSEGFAVCTEYFFTPGSLDNDRKLSLAIEDLLTPELVYSTTGQFYSNPVFYQVSGAFTKYLIDRLGMQEFIKAYAANRIGEVLVEKTGSDMEETIILFRQSLKDFDHTYHR